MTYVLFQSTDLQNQRFLIVDGEVRFQRDWWTLAQSTIMSACPFKTVGALGVALFRGGWSAGWSIACAVVSCRLWMLAPVPSILLWCVDLVIIWSLHLGDYRGSTRVVVKNALGVPACLSGFTSTAFAVCACLLQAVVLVYNREIFQVHYDAMPKSEPALEGQSSHGVWERLSQAGSGIVCAAATAGPGTLSYCDNLGHLDSVHPKSTGWWSVGVWLRNLWEQYQGYQEPQTLH